MKRLKVCIIFFFLILYGVPVHAASYYTEGYFQYHLKDTYASICGYFGKEEVVRIPSALGGKPVKEIEDYSFQNAAGVQEIQIPATVLSIGDNAFTGAEELKRVEKDTLENQKPQDQLPGNSNSGQPEGNAPGQTDDDMEQPGNTDQKEDPGQPDPVSPGADPEETKEPEKTTENDQRPESITETQQGQTSGDELKESQSSEEKTDTESGAAGNSAVQESDGDSFSEAEGEEYEETKIVSSALKKTPVGETDFSETGQELLPEEETEYIGDSAARKDTQEAALTPVLIICVALVLAAGIGGAMYKLHKKTGRG